MTIGQLILVIGQIGPRSGTAETMDSYIGSCGRKSALGICQLDLIIEQLHLVIGQLIDRIANGI